MNTFKKRVQEKTVTGYYDLLQESKGELSKHIVAGVDGLNVP